MGLQVGLQDVFGCTGQLPTVIVGGSFDDEDDKA